MALDLSHDYNITNSHIHYRTEIRYNMAIAWTYQVIIMTFNSSYIWARIMPKKFGLGVRRNHDWKRNNTKPTCIMLMAEHVCNLQELVIIIVKLRL